MTNKSVKEVMVLAVEAHRNSKFQEADQLYSSVLKVFPNHPDANHNMGVLATDVGLINRAVSFFKKAYVEFPSHPQFSYSLVEALMKLGDFETARAQLKSSKKELNARDSQALTDRLHSGEFKLKDILNLGEPPDNLIQVCRTLCQQGRFTDAIQATEKWIILLPKSTQLNNIRGAAQAGLENFSDAIHSFKLVLTKDPKNFSALQNLGVSLYNTREFNEAERFMKLALVENGTSASCHFNLGNIYSALGQLDMAGEKFKSAIGCDNTYAEAFYNLSKITKLSKESELFKLMQRLDKDKVLSDGRSYYLQFALASVYEDMGNESIALNYYKKANRSRLAATDYQVERDIAKMERLKTLQPKMADLSVKGAVAEDIQPIFIVSMPRSGSTLVEQIISNHKSVYGAGELPYIQQLSEPLLSKGDLLTLGDFAQIRSSYLSQIADISGGLKIVTDKMPFNFIYVPVILSAFPDAILIHVVRDPSATCWSNFTNCFENTNLDFTYDLSSLGAYYNAYSDLMDHWDVVYPDRIINCDYDFLTENPSTQIEDLIYRLGLEWDEMCLFPHKNDRTVTTASQHQVKRPIYSGSSNRWLKYKPLLKGVFDNLTKPNINVL